MSSAKCRPFCLSLNMLSASPAILWNSSLVITVAADVLMHLMVPGHQQTQSFKAETVLTVKTDIKYQMN